MLKRPLLVPAIHSRRAFLRSLLGSAVLPLLAACAGTATAPATAPTAAGRKTAANSAATSAGSTSNATSKAASAPASAGTKLVFLSRGSIQYQQAFKESIANFQQKYSSISIENQPVSGNFDQKLETLLAGNVAPDVFFGMAATFLAYPFKGETIALDSYASRATDFKASDYYPYWLRTMQWKGKLVGLPYDPDMVVLYYNKTLFDKVQLPYPDPKTPMTWDQLLTVAQQLTIDGKGNRGSPADPSQVVQFGLDPMYARMWWHLPRQYGVETFNADLTKIDLDQSAALDALQVLIDLGHKYHVTTTPNSGDKQPSDFPSGNLAMIINGGWQRGLFLEQVKAPWDIAPLPQAKGQKPVGMGWASGLMITKQSKVPEQGWQFLAYLAGKEGQSLLIKEGISQPMLTSMADDPNFTAASEPAHRDVLLNETANGDPPPYIPAYMDVQNVIQTDFLDVTESGKQDVKTAIAAAVPKINAILEQYKAQYGA